MAVNISGKWQVNPSGIVTPSGLGTPMSVFGYASLNGGTTGGAANPSNPIVSVTNYNDLKTQALLGNRTIIIASNITGNGTTNYGWTNTGSNLTIVGANPNIELNGFGMWWYSASTQTQNIILRNLKMQLVPDLGSVGKSPIDYLSFKGPADKSFTAPRNIWVDHCHLLSSNDNTRHDGLIDFTNGVDFITVSNCRLENEGNASIGGNADPYVSAPTSEQLRITWAYNWYLNCGERQPKTSHGRQHVIHNLVERTVPYGGTPGSGYKGYALGYGRGGFVRLDGMILLNEDNMYETYNTQGTDLFGVNAWGRLRIGQPTKKINSTGSHYQPQPLLTDADYPIPYEFESIVHDVQDDTNAQAMIDYIKSKAGNTLTLSDMGL